MKVIQINSVSGVGSTGRIAEDLSRTMTDYGIENYIYYGSGSSEYFLSKNIGSKINTRVHQLHTRLLGWHGYSSKSSTKNLITELERIKPDIVHIHNIHGFYLNIELLLSYLSKSEIPVVWTLHDCWLFTGHCAHFDYVGCDKWLTGCHECPQLSSYPVSWIFDRSENQWVDKKRLVNSIENITFISPSKWLQQLAKKSIIGDNEVKVINNGIDLDRFKPTESNFKVENGIDDKFIILGVASNWNSRKGLNYFIELSKRLNINYQIVLVGAEKDQIKALPNNIITVSHTDSVEELAGLYSIADVFVNPTLEDNFPTVNLEGLACGAPVVTFDTGGSPEGLNEMCGVIVGKGNIKELKIAIENICENKIILRGNCLLQAQLFNKNDRHLEYINLYNYVLYNK